MFTKNNSVDINSQIKEQLSADLENDTADGQPIECPENFFFNESGRLSSCAPICGEFSFFQREIIVLHKVAVCLCFIASLAMIVITLTTQRKKM